MNDCRVSHQLNREERGSYRRPSWGTADHDNEKLSPRGETMFLYKFVLLSSQGKSGYGCGRISRPTFVTGESTAMCVLAYTTHFSMHLAQSLHSGK